MKKPLDVSASTYAPGWMPLLGCHEWQELFYQTGECEVVNIVAIHNCRNKEIVAFSPLSDNGNIFACFC